jgi:hypothetical protein
MFRLITKVLFFISNHTLLTNLKIITILEATIKSYARYQNSLFNYPNILAKNLANPMSGNHLKKLKIKCCRDLLF